MERFLYFLPIIRIFRFTQICCLGGIVGLLYAARINFEYKALALKSWLTPGQTGRVQLHISSLRAQISVTTNHSLVAISVGLSVSHSKIWLVTL